VIREPLKLNSKQTAVNEKPYYAALKIILKIYSRNWFIGKISSTASSCQKAYSLQNYFGKYLPRPTAYHI